MERWGVFFCCTKALYNAIKSEKTAYTCVVFIITTWGKHFE